MTEAQREQRKLEDEVDREAARLIRDKGIPLFQALEIAQRIVASRRRFGM